MLYFLSSMVYGRLAHKCGFFKIPKPHHTLPLETNGKKNIQIDNLSSFVLHFDGFVESKVDDDDG